MRESVHLGRRKNVEAGADVARRDGALAPYHANLEIGWSCILAGLVVSLYSDTRIVPLWVIAIIFAAVEFLATKTIRMRAVDWGVLLIAALEFIALFSLQYRANSIHASAITAAIVTIYFAIRLTIRRPIQMALLSGVLGLGGAWNALTGMGQFKKHAEQLASAGFFNLVAFRSRLIVPPAQWISGDWFTVLLLAIPFACGVLAYLWRRGETWPTVIALFPPLLVTATLTLSLSRAVFWSIVLFCFSACIFLVFSKVLSPRAGVTLLAGALGSVVLILACESAIYPGLIKAYAGQHTSQTRSTQGRIEIWRRSMELVRAHPLMGVGSANSAFMLLSSADDEETTGFASRTFSLPVQVLVEKGIVGFIVYTSFLVLLAREFVRTIRYPSTEAAPKNAGKTATQANTRAIVEANDDSAYKAMVCCLAAGLVAVLLRELTYSSLMEHSLTFALAATLAALVCRPEAVRVRS